MNQTGFVCHSCSVLTDLIGLAVPRVPCKRKADPCELLSVQNFVRTRFRRRLSLFHFRCRWVRLTPPKGPWFPLAISEVLVIKAVKSRYSFNSFLLTLCLQYAQDDTMTEERAVSRTHEIIQRTSQSSLSIPDRLIETGGDPEMNTAQRQGVRRFVVMATFRTDK